MMQLRTLARSALFAAAALFLMPVLPAQAAVTLTEGVNYKTLEPAVPPSTAPGKVEVVEVFWYHCGHCYALEPKLDAWARSKPGYVELVRQPATWNDMLKTHARIFYTAELLGKLPQLHEDVFREMNVRGATLDSASSIEAYFASRGVPKADFQRAFASFAVESKLRRADDLNRRYRITGTPTFIVAGKYTTDVGMAGSEDKLFEVINALAAREKR